ncbi:MAG: DUF1801 domain-containing protein [Phycisphaerales bacterium]|nr:DUF1801 domain-containing protein [Phycisphaerales bacterium]
MKSSAPTVAAYLESLPPDRREAIETVRGVILESLNRANAPGEFEECMQYGVIAYCVPHSLWPHGHHTRPELPLMFLGLSSQKNDMVVYMLLLLHNEPMRAWFVEALRAGGKPIKLDVGGMGCCVRFRRIEDLAPDVIAETIRRVPVRAHLEHHAAMLARLGKGPDGKRPKVAKGADKAAGGPAAPASRRAASAASVRKGGAKPAGRASASRAPERPGKGSPGARETKGQGLAQSKNGSLRGARTKPARTPSAKSKRASRPRRP